MEDGQRLCAEIIQKINDQDAQITRTSSFFAKLVMKVQKRPLTYQEICDLVEQKDAEELGQDKLWTYSNLVTSNGKDDNSLSVFFGKTIPSQMSQSNSLQRMIQSLWLHMPCRMFYYQPLDGDT